MTTSNLTRMPKSSLSRLRKTSPHGLILVLLDHAVLRVDGGIQAILSGEPASREMLLGQAIRIIRGLRDLTDQRNGGEIARNLRLLYNFSLRELRIANRRNDAGKTQEVLELILLLRAGWREIPVEYHHYTERLRAGAAT